VPDPILAEAVAIFQRGLDLNPAYSNLAVALGEARTLQGAALHRAGGDPSGAWTDAEARFQAALVLVQEHPEARIGLGRLWLARATAAGTAEAWRQARAWADLATRRHPDNHAAWLLLAQVERGRAEAAAKPGAAAPEGWSAALKAAEACLQRAPGNPEAGFERLRILRQLSSTRGPQAEAFHRELAAFLDAHPRHAGAQALRAGAAPPGA
jgi:tetratricopeptide (TPR) repeat protein